MTYCSNRVLTNGAVGVVVLTLGSIAIAGEKDAKTKPCAPVAITHATVVAPVHIGPETISNNISPDKLAVTVLFDSLVADYGQEQDAKKFTPLNTAFLEIPLTAGNIGRDCDLLGYTVDVRGFVDVTEGGRATVTLLFAGQSQQIEFPFDKQFNGDFNKRFFFLPQQVGEQRTAVARSPLRIQMLIQAETAQPRDSSLVQVESLEVEARTVAYRDKNSEK